MRRVLGPVSLVLSALLWQTSYAAHYTLIVAGLGGEKEYEQRFREQAGALAEAALKLAGTPDHVASLIGQKAQRATLRRELHELARKAGETDQVTIVLIGHGSFDGEEYRFNIPGPDITATELGGLIDAIPARQQLIVNATSASGAAIDRWKRDQRIVVTATKSGAERNATRFAQYWVQALTSAEADRDKNEFVTAREAFDFALRATAEYFKADVSLATEHARIEGSQAESFPVARLGTTPELVVDMELLRLLEQRTGIEQALDAVKARKTQLTHDAYYDELEKVLIELALLDRQIDRRQAEVSP